MSRLFFSAVRLCCKIFLLPVVVIASLYACSCHATGLDFSIIPLGKADRVVLVVGGIQGDEPGGFSAATLLATRYVIKSGAVWIVPNLNFPSIIQRSRGLYGDMNRKFARLDDNDPEFSSVKRIQKLISHPSVGLVLNLHDGSGYYRKTHENKLCNPKRWGQSIVIDQETLGQDVFMSSLLTVAEKAAAEVNGKLLKPLHAINIHNTNTAAGDKEMEKSLSYYAVRQGKAAFGLEASKEFNVENRAYYHLCLLEAFLRQAGVVFSRDFDLTPSGVGKALRENLGVSFAGNRVFLPLEDVRPTIRFLPLPKNCIDSAVTSKPIMAVLPCKGQTDELCVHYGNRTITLIKPDWQEMDYDISAVTVNVDGRDKLVPFGHILDVRQALAVKPASGIRVNAIGYHSKVKNEAGITLRHRDFEKSFSIDRQGSMFRIEVYRGNKFSGLFIIRFLNSHSGLAKTDNKKIRAIMPDSPGPESNQGF